jgi:hypothetical protein
MPFRNGRKIMRAMPEFLGHSPPVSKKDAVGRPQAFRTSDGIGATLLKLRLFRQCPKVISPDGFELAVGLAAQLNLIITGLNQAGRKVNHDLCLAIFVGL